MTVSSGVADGRTSGADIAAASLPPTTTPLAAVRAAIEAAVRQHDAATQGAAPVWLGAEPTFTDRYSESREWLCEALGADKEARARKLLARLLERHPGAAVLRPLGRP